MPKSSEKYQGVSVVVKKTCPYSAEFIHDKCNVGAANPTPWKGLRARKASALRFADELIEKLKKKEQSNG